MESSLEAFFDNFVVYVIAQLHASLEVTLIVTFCAFGFYVLLDSINLTFVANQALLDII